MKFVERLGYRRQLEDMLAAFPVVALLGPRRCGKTTLAKSLVVDPTSYFDLEDPVDLARLETPRLTLGSLRGLVILDEIQQRPDLFSILRVLADRPDVPARFLILGSASPSLVRGASESLAGRQWRACWVSFWQRRLSPRCGCCCATSMRNCSMKNLSRQT